MAIEIIDKKKCSGCYACYNSCPKKCIEMKEDECGFKYPVVDTAQCTSCSLCEQICPINGKSLHYYEPISVYAAWSKDEDVRYSSTSGGAFSELAFSILREGGVVSGAVYDENNVIEHTIIDSVEDVVRARQSKYAQSNINDVFVKIRGLLSQRTVLFCGTPCQVAGLRSFLRKDYSNLITVDFICRGVNSPKALRAWVKEIESLNGSRVQRIWFKFKEDGWHKSPKCTKVDFANGSEMVYKGKDNAFMHGYLGPNLYIRPSCSDCIFKGNKRVSDITLGDFWGVEESLDDNKGTSLMIINSDKGKKLLSAVQESLVLTQKSVSEIEDGNVCFKGSVKISPKSEQFLKRLDQENFSVLVYKYSKESILKRGLRFIKFKLNKIRKRG